MTLSKCPRCELNYITDGEQYCKICRLEMKGEPVRDEIEMCTMCGEHPAMPGKDVCLFCYKEMNGTENSQEDEEGIVVTEDAAIGIDPLSTMDEIIPESDGDDGAMSLEALGEEEEENDDLDDDDDQDDGMPVKRRK
ncbi:MAG: hypothetical protein IJ157_07510 [Clostridia bacterium]|nr:hypothetical protein [Clostridia bacterium]